MTTVPYSRTRAVVEMKFGSHLYGTATPASDLDIKAVHLPEAREILLGRVKPVISEHSKIDRTQKNSADDTDYESYSLQRYLGLVAEGQTVALDMLFAPDFALLSPVTPIWHEIRANRHRLLTRKYAAFVGYCRTQANKYGIKGSRVAAARTAMETMKGGLERHGTTAKLEIMGGELAPLADLENVQILDIEGGLAPGQDVRKAIRHLEVCGRKMPYTSTIKSAYEIMARLVAEYGQRALQAESNQGVDWKALSHAVRIGRQAIEVLDTGNVVFPRPDAAHLLRIKRGELDYQLVGQEIEDLLVEIEAASVRSTLPDRPDIQWIDDFVAGTYRRIIES